MVVVPRPRHNPLPPCSLPPIGYDVAAPRVGARSRPRTPTPRKIAFPWDATPPEVGRRVGAADRLRQPGAGAVRVGLRDVLRCRVVVRPGERPRRRLDK